MKAQRRWWKQSQGQWDPARLVFIDETSLNTKLAPLYGRAPVGQRCLGKEPHGHWQCSTFICALRHESLGSPMLLDGTMNGECFLAYIQQVLIPDLRPGDTVICDNLASHKVAGVATALIQATAKALDAFLPTHCSGYFKHAGYA